MYSSSVSRTSSFSGQKPIVFSDKLRREVITIRENIINIIDYAEAPIINENSKCGSCYYEDICKNYFPKYEKKAQNCEINNQCVNHGPDFLNRINNSPGESFSLYEDSGKEVIE